MTYKIDTKVMPSGAIHQEVTHKFEDMTRTITKQIVDTQDAQIRDALIELGWTPPDETCLWDQLEGEDYKRPSALRCTCPRCRLRS